MKVMLSGALLASIPSMLFAVPEEPQDLAPILAPILEGSGLPSLAAALVVGDELRAIGAVGVRKLGDEEPVTVTDKYHLGSCTKTMTATLAAVLVEDGILEWDSTVGEVLGKKVRHLHEGFANVTLEQLLAHVGGLPGTAPPVPWVKAYAAQGKESPEDQRLAFVRALLSEEPAYPAGSKSVYSNQGYAVAGAMMEVRAGKSWEELMRERLFKPLGMDSAGFREPASGRREPDQPWGHKGKVPVAPGPRADNPDAIGPAATVHASIGDWAKFAQFHLLRQPGRVLKEAASFDRLHQTLEESDAYGVGGWLVHDIERYGGHCLQMTGSNTMWFALMWILPGQDRAILVTTNCLQGNAFATCDQVAAALMKLGVK